MKTDMVKQYYRDPKTGVEMNFTKTDQWGWSVSFPHFDVMEALDYDVEIPWPVLSKEEKAVVDGNYTELKKKFKGEE